MGKPMVSQLSFDLASIREVRRLANRVVKRLTVIERNMLKWKRSETKRKAESRRKKKVRPVGDSPIVPEAPVIDENWKNSMLRSLTED